MAQTKYLSLDGLYYLWSLIKTRLDNKQAVISDLETIRSNASTGAGLATKVNGIEAGAEVNVIESIIYDGNALTVSNKSVTIPVPDLSNYLTTAQVYTKSQIDSKLTSAMHYKGSVATYADLPASDNAVGDFYNVTATGANYAWTGSTWDETGQIVDLSAYVQSSDLVAVTNSEIDTVLAS